MSQRPWRDAPAFATQELPRPLSRGAFEGGRIGHCAFFAWPIVVTYTPSRMSQELQNFIVDGARRITPAHLDKLVRLLPKIRLAVTQVTEFPNLPDQVEF